MKTLILLLFLCVVSNASDSFYDVLCDESVERGLYFEPVSKVRGRFALKWCTEANISVTKWELHLYYCTALKREQCNKDFYHLGNCHFHSVLNEPVQFNSNCTNVCFSATLDAIFSSTCYYIDIEQFSETEVKDSPYPIHVSALLNSLYKQYYYVGETNLTIEDFTKIEPLANTQNDGQDVVIDWYPGIPVSRYEVYMSRNGSDDKVYMDCSTVSPLRVQCRARAADGFYSATFRHTVPWTSLELADLSTFHHSFPHRVAPDIPGSVPATGSLWWALGGAGGALLLGALLLLLLLLQRAARAGKLKQNVLRSWVDDIARRLERGGAARAAGRVLLLYARDCEHMTRAALHLAALLKHAGCEVVDLYSAETVAAAAPAPAPWLRALLLRAGTRVLLVQSPAAAAYCARLARAPDGSPALEAPLLGRRAAWRAPHAADAQLLLALRLLADAAPHEPLPYRKYYVATVAGLQHDDVVPALTPQRRYVLPHAAELLLRDLAPPQHPDPTQPAHPDPTPPAHPDPTPPAHPDPMPPAHPDTTQLLRLLTEALEDFRLYALNNPNYLFDDMMFE